MPWNVRSIESWAELLDVQQTLIDGEALDSFIFRGQPYEEDTLQPSLTRICKTKDRSLEETLQIESILFNRFRQRAIEYLPSYIHEAGDNLLSWFSIMQHHGVPTRLLDWSLSLYVAVYFAVQDFDTNGAVFCIQRHRSLKTINDALNVKDYYSKELWEMAMIDAPENNPYLQYYRKGIYVNEDEAIRLRLLRKPTESLHTWAPHILTNRLTAQQGIFTFSPNILADHYGIISKHCDPEMFHHVICTKFVIPKERKPEFARRLLLSNISAAALYPDLDGFGKSLRELAIQL